MKNAFDPPTAFPWPAPGEAGGLPPGSHRQGAFRLTVAVLVLLLLAGHPMFVRPAQAQAALPAENTSRLAAAAVRFYDEVERDDWTGAMSQLQQIGKAAEPAVTRFDASSAPLAEAIIRSARAVHRHDRIGALHAANKIREWADLEVASARDDFPAELARLCYAARELQIEAMREHPRRTAERIQEVRQCWEKLKPVLEKGGDPATVTDGEARIRTLEAAEAQAALREVSGPFSQWVEKLKREIDATKP